MAGDVLLLCEASPALDEFEATGWKVLLGLTEPFFESGLISMLVRERS
jgi:hypothetical protein